MKPEKHFHNERLGLPPIRDPSPTGPVRTTMHPAQPADRVTDNRDQFRKRWRRVSEATNFTEAAR
jgi:hypothetical protein